MGAFEKHGEGTATARVVLPDRAGLHARPCTRIARAAEPFLSDSWLHVNGRKARTISIFDMLELAVGCSTEIEVTAEGPDAAQCVAAIVDVIAREQGDPETRL